MDQKEIDQRKAALAAQREAAARRDVAQLLKQSTTARGCEVIIVKRTGQA